MAGGIGDWKPGDFTVSTSQSQCMTLRWLRVPGDTVFALGAIALVLFVAGLKTGHSIRMGTEAEPAMRELESVSLERD